MNDEHRTNGVPAEDRPHGRSRRASKEPVEDMGTAAAAEEVAELRERLARAEQELADARAGWQRTAADFQNFRRRSEQEREEMLGLASEALLRKVLTVADDLDRAMAQLPTELADVGWVAGIASIDRKLRQLLESEGLSPMDAAGQPFDPREHDAVAHEETDVAPDGTVLAEIQRGYRLRDRVLRPAMVTVAKNETSRTTNDTGREAAGGKD